MPVQQANIYIRASVDTSESKYVKDPMFRAGIDLPAIAGDTFV